MEGQTNPDNVEQNGNHVEDQKERRRKRPKGSILKKYLMDYTSNSNLHGLKYIGEKERTIPEKIFWACIFILCITLCAILIRKLWVKWDQTPVIVTFAEMPTPVWKIPYPAITICVETKSMQTVFNFTKYYHLYNNSYETLSKTEREMLEDVSLLCDEEWIPKKGRNFSTGAEIMKTYEKVAPNKTHFFLTCFFNNSLDYGCSMFSSLLTEEGQCYTFNTLGAQDLFRMENIHEDYTRYLSNFNKPTGWSLDDGYPNRSPAKTYPIKGFGYGLQSAVNVLMRTKIHDIDYLCKGAVQGFKVTLHNPAEFPRPSLKFFRAPLQQEVMIAVKPKMMTTTPGLKSYNPIRRQCYFQDERYLTFFKIYTQSNCELECLTNFTNVRCGCVHFGAPYAPGTKVCNAGKMACLKQAEMELVTAGADSDLYEEKGNTENDTLWYARETAGKCNCLPACTDLQYEAETSQADYNWTALVRAFRIQLNDEEDKNNDHARIRMFFKEPQFITSRRSELYGQTDFLANCGGVLGLFLGFSLLSIVEILYFLTLRVCCLWWRRHEDTKHKNKGDSKVVEETKD